MLRAWRGKIVREGFQTGDGRIIEPGALTWETPIPLAWLLTGTQHVDMGGEAPTIGTVTEITRGADGWLDATGVIDDENPAGAEMIRQLEAGAASHGDRMGVSVDLANMAIDIIDRTGDSGDVILASLRGVTAAAGDPMPDDGEVVWSEAQDDIIQAVTRASIIGLTCVATPAFGDSFLELDDTAAAPEAEAEPVAAAASMSSGTTLTLTRPLVSNSTTWRAIHVDTVAPARVPVPLAPPAEWFLDPNLGAPTRMTIDDDGRLYGHLAAWGTCHTGYVTCVQPPRGGDYGTFMSASGVETDDGYRVDTGALVWGIPHADLSLSLLDAFHHYEIPAHGFADVRVGEDAHGIWFAGALRPHVTVEDLRTLRALSISGDWRRRAGRLDLIAGLAVNYPGFPIPRNGNQPVVASAAYDHGVIDSLVAAGVIPNPDAAADLPMPCSCGTSGTQSVSPVPGWATALDAKLDRLLARTAPLVPDAVAAAARRLPHR